jgi:hypothetical protein
VFVYRRQNRQTLAVFLIALLFACLLIPLVGFVERVTPHQVSPLRNFQAEPPQMSINVD